MSRLHEGERGPAPGQGLSDLGGRQSRGKEQHGELGSTAGAPHRDSRPVSTALVPESAWALTAGVLLGVSGSMGRLLGAGQPVKRCGGSQVTWRGGTESRAPVGTVPVKVW